MGKVGGISWREFRDTCGKQKDKWRALQLVCAATGYDPLEHQLRAHLATAHNKLLLGGIGSGKTMWSCAELICQIVMNPGCSFGAFSPTFDGVMNVQFPVFEDFCTKMAVAGYPLMRKFNKSMAKADLVGGGSVYFRSFLKIDSIRGFQIAGAAIDESEVANDPVYVWNVVAGRIRCPKANTRHIWATSTPRGLRGVVGLFVDRRMTNDKENWWAARASSMDNTHLPDGYLRTVHQGYSKRLFEQEVLARVLRPSHVIFDEYNPAQHVIPYKFDPSMPYDIACDWGYNHPYVAWIQRLPNGQAVIFDEFIDDEVPRDLLRQEITKRCAALKREPEYAVGDRADRSNMFWLINRFPRTHVRRMKTKEQQSIREGIEVVRSRLDPLDGPPMLFVAQKLTGKTSRRGAHNAFQNYRWALHRDGSISDQAWKDGTYDHAMDSIRMWSVVHNDQRTQAFVLKYGESRERKLRRMI